MSALDYPMETSWGIDIAEDTSLPQDVVPMISQNPTVSGFHRKYQPGRDEASFYHQTEPWIMPPTAYLPRRQNTSNIRRLRHVSTPLRSHSTTSRAPVDGLMIHVEKRTRDGGMVTQIPLPTCLPSDASPATRRSTNHTIPSRASSQSFAQDDTASASASNGPITPNISPAFSTTQEIVKPVMAKPTYDMGGEPQGSFDESGFEHVYMPTDLSFIEQQAGVWDMTNTYHQTGMGYGYCNYPSRYGMPQQDHLVYSMDGQTLNDQYLNYRRNFTVPDQVRNSSTKKPARKHFTPEVTNILKTWFKDNLQRPYPSEETKQELLRQTGLTMNQLSNWFINARRRNWRRSRLAKDA